MKDDDAYDRLTKEERQRVNANRPPKKLQFNVDLTQDLEELRASEKALLQQLLDIMKKKEPAPDSLPNLFGVRTSYKLGYKDAVKDMEREIKCLTSS